MQDDREKGPRPSLAWYDEVTAVQPPAAVDLILARTQNVRAQLIRETLANTDSLDLLLDGGDRSKAFQKLLEAADKQALTLKRIAADEGIADAQAAAKQQLVLLFHDKRVKDLSRNLVEDTPTRSGPPELPDAFANVDLIAGELQDGLTSEGYDEFSARMTKASLAQEGN